MTVAAPLQSIIIVATGEPDRIEDIHALARRHASETHLLNEQALADWLGRADAAEIEPAVLIFAPSLERPAGLARTAQQRWSRCELLFVREPSTLADFRQQLGMAPMLGIHWAVVPDDDTLEDVLALASQTARRRARLRTTLDTANLSLPSRPDSQVQKRQAMADHYLASFIDFAQEAIVGLDASQQVMFWSAGAEELFGLSSAAAVGQYVRALHFWNPDMDEALRALTAGTRSVLVESTLLQDAQPIALEILSSAVRDETQTLIGVSLMIRDVSAIAAQRLAHRAELQAERQHLHQLFQQAPGFVVVTQGPRHLVELANRAFYQLVGHRDVIGRPAADAFPEVESQPVRDLLDRVYATRRPFVGRGVAVHVPGARQAARQLRYVDFVFQPVLSEHGLITGIFCQGHDVTAQRLAQEQLQRSEEHLQALVDQRTRELERSQQALHQSQKLEAIGKLTGGVAHDFNNVLQIIGANLQLIRAAVSHDERLGGRIDLASAAVERGAKLSSQLLAFARRQPLSPAPTNLARLLRDMDGLLRRALGEYVEIETVVAGGLWTTLVDPNQLENVVLNLAINARDAMRGGGRLTLELSNAMLDDEYAHAAGDVTPGQHVLLAVSDTGIGMSAEVIERVFEPFFTTKPEGEGAGLGLSMAYGFAKQSGGHIPAVQRGRPWNHGQGLSAAHGAGGADTGTAAERADHRRARNRAGG
jgi:PAS domain S-box-containing protein